VSGAEDRLKEAIKLMRESRRVLTQRLTWSTREMLIARIKTVLDEFDEFEARTIKDWSERKF